MGYQPLTAILVDGVKRRILSKRSAGNGYVALKLDDPKNPGVPVAEMSVPQFWLDDSNDRSRVRTGGCLFEKIAAFPPRGD